MKYGDVKLGQVEALLNKIGGEEGMKAILSGRATIAHKEHIIDLDADPLIPFNNWKVEEHKKGGKFTWDSTKVELFLNKEQKEGGSIEGNELRNELIGEPVFNANLLDYLLDNPHLIPEEWKGKSVFFWGTIYCGFNGPLYVRYLFFSGGHCGHSNYELGNVFGAGNPSLLSAS